MTDRTGGVRSWFRALLAVGAALSLGLAGSTWATARTPVAATPVAAAPLSGGAAVPPAAATAAETPLPGGTAQAQLAGGTALGPQATSTTPATEAALAPWTGGLDLYRPGVYTMQATWYWCTAANVQIMRNMAFHQADHSTADQSRYFSYMRAHDRYSIPITDGTDPQGWADGLARYVDSRYRLVTYTSFDAALHDAVTRMRLTGLPVSLAVMHGNHAWVLNGFTATADPARTSRFTVTNVRVTGPLYGRQSVNGYDMPPDTMLTTAAFRTFFTPFHYARVHMVWEGSFITIQPIPRAAAPVATPVGAPHAGPAATPAGLPGGAVFPWSMARPGLA
ncbi:MAG TPA: hypothetical protein VEI48_12015 [Candidatus Sulfotelmatobacter sp.]|nr:hypothetical protein [Candidatus Sulfotelmatobacter sp.]